MRADQSGIIFRKRRESTWGVFAAGALRTLNIVTDGLKGGATVKRSATSRANRMPGPRRKVAVVGAGPLVFDMTYGAALKELLEDAFLSAFSSQLAVSGTTISFASADNSINDSANGFGSVVAGTWVKVLVAAATPSGWTDPYVFVVSKPTSGKIIVAYQTLSNVSAGPAMTITGAYLRNGSTLISNTYERENSEFTTDKFQAYRGQVVASLELRFNFEEIIQATVNLTGLGPDVPTALSIANPTSATAAESMDTIVDVSNNMRAFRSDGTLDGNVKNLTLTLNNQTEYIKLAQTRNPDGISLGVAMLSGSLEGYLVDGSARRTKAWGDSPDSLHWRVTDDAGNTLFFTIFRLFYTEMGDQPKTGQTGPVPFALAWEADPSSTYAGYWIQVCDFPAP